MTAAAIDLGGVANALGASHPPETLDPSPSRSAQMSLIGRCVAGEPDAWRALHRIYYPVAAAFLLKLGVLGEDLDDACQDVFVRMFRYLSTFRGEAELKTWLYRLCVTEARNTRRRFRLAGTVQKLLRHELAARPVVSGPVLSVEMARRKMHSALATLKENERLAFTLYEMEGLSGQQIAEVAGCPVATVWRRLHHARRRFQSAIGEPADALS